MPANDSELIKSIELAGLQTEKGDFQDVAVEIYHGWVKITDDTGTRWVPRDTVIEIFEQE